jgi:hypothetical protein
MKRRDAIKHGLLGAGAVLGAPWLGRGLWAQPSIGAKAKAVIQVWMWGGPGHLDTFDPKPAAGYDYCGAFAQPIATNVEGVLINELLTQLAKQADKYSLIRSMTHGINAHETASYTVQTGRRSNGHDVFPSAGAVVSLFKGYNAGYQQLVPPYIVLTKPQGRFDEAGFLGPKYAPFATGGDPAQTRFVVEGVVAQNVSDDRQRARRALLQQLGGNPRPATPDSALDAFTRSENQAYDLILGDAGKVFDLSQESDDLRARYGRNTFGASCLVARRLVERGVPYVTINYEGWDTHKQNFQVLRQKLPQFDQGLATLLQDLTDRGLLDSTIVWCGGEFGRRPRIDWEAPWNGGRNHHGAVFSTLIAGGGFHGGHVVGSSDARGEEVRDRPVAPTDLIASIYHLLGIDPDARLPHPQGLDMRAIPGVSEGMSTNGILKEIL